MEGFLEAIEDGGEKDSQIALYFNEVLDNESVFLEQMDSIVYLYEVEATKSLKIMKITHMVLFLLIMIILTFIAFKVLIPLFQNVDNAFRKLNESNGNLIKMFHTMEGALFVIKKDGEIIFMNSAAENIISKNKEYNGTLYLETSVRWIAFNINNLIKKAKDSDTRIDGIETTIKDKDGNLMAVIMSAFSGNYEGHEVVVLNLFDLTAQKKAEEILKDSAIKDELTGLYNRRFLESIVDSEFERAQRYKIPLSAALLDLDFFKKVNDQWGHPVGDTVLKMTADIIKNNIRKSDYAIRIGGEEILILMTNTNSKGALAIAEKLRQAIENTVHPIIGRFTASFGVAQRMTCEKYQYLYERVDEALYQAKENGRNCVVLAESESCEFPIVPLQWNDKWNCGETKIDQQHKDLFRQASG